MTIYSYKISEIDIHNIHNEKEIEIEYLRLIFYHINILKNSFTWYTERTVVGSWGVLSWDPGAY